MYYNYEGLLMDRESALRTEETRRLAHFESRSREAADDIHRHRHRVDVEILEARCEAEHGVNYNLSSVEIFYSCASLFFDFCFIIYYSEVTFIQVLLAIRKSSEVAFTHIYALKDSVQ
jgi:hypothetical protein